MMGLEELRERKDILMQIDWELSPLEAVEMFDHRAGGLKSRLQVRSQNQKHYFFAWTIGRKRPGWFSRSAL